MEPHFLFMNDVQITPCFAGRGKLSVRIQYVFVRGASGLGRIHYRLVS